MMPESVQVQSDKEGTTRTNRTGALWVVAGPRNAETEDGLLTTARSIKPSVSAFSAGLWGSDGVGAAGLPWLRRVREEIGLKTAVEVARPVHVDACLRHGVDILGLDPRATTDTFLLGELASALRGVEVTVLVKNPLDPDVRGWVGAFERLSLAGVGELIGVHQGFFTTCRSPYRYPPNWTVVTELRRLMPHLEVICDPSSIAGASHLVSEVARHAVDMQATGLLIATNESSDAVAQGHEISPGQLQRLLAALMPGARGDGEGTLRDAVASIDALRQQIDVVDSTLLRALAQRMSLVEQIGRHKKAASLTAVQIDRWVKLVEQRLHLGRSLRLTEGFVLALFELIHSESIKLQNALMQSPHEKVS